MATYTSRSNQNEKRQTIEAALAKGGLVQIAGGTRNSYFGLPGQGVDGYCIRVGIRTFRLVRRYRLSTGLTDVSVGKEYYHGKAQPEKVVGGGRPSWWPPNSAPSSRLPRRSRSEIVMKPTIYQALVTKLGRDPTDAEVKADVERIMEEGLIERASQGKLQHQRRRRSTRRT